MSTPPLVTIVIPAFNTASFIGEAIASVRAQTLDDWQLTVVDDGSADDTLSAAQAAAGNDPRIQIIRFERNAGISAASNAGFDAARGEFIARLDSDDRALPNRLAVQVAAFRSNERLAAAGSSARIFGAADGVAPAVLGDANLKARLSWSPNTIGGNSMMVRRAFVRRHGIRFDDDLRSSEDLDYIASVVAAGGELANVDEVLFEHRAHAGSFTHSQHALARSQLQIVRRRILRLWYPQLAGEDIDHVVAMFVEPYAPQLDALLNTVRALDRLLKAAPADYGQDNAVVHSILLERLPAMATLYRDHQLLNASHLQAVRCFAHPAIGEALDTLNL
ncbi:MAG TPA: glycosyltransferase family 2 protein [Burkholderiaceae bacterium]|nr:glycosyltransferase family 2 protein [Burkholderiaceae bacterium]